jgi:plastocyanin
MPTLRRRTDDHVRVSRRVVAVLGLLLALSTVAAGCSSSPSGAGSGGATISMSNLEFSPSTITVSPGQTITAVNNDQVSHDITGNSGDFATGTIAPGQTKTFTAPVAPGRYGFTCTLHPFMNGTIIVH